MIELARRAFFLTFSLTQCDAVCCPRPPALSGGTA
jgi:hypothetical protein